MIEGVLTTEEVDELNAAIDHHVPLLNAQPSNAMGGRTPGMIGDRNVHSLIAAHLNEQRGTDLGPVDIMDMLLEAGYPAQGRSVNFGQALSQAERQEIIAEMKSRQSEEVFASALSNVAPGGVPLSEDEKAAILGLLSTWRTENDEGSVVRMGTTRTDLNGMLSWDEPFSTPFRKLLVHPKVKPYLEEICGKGYRMDHMPHVSIAHKGADGQNLHGGAAQRYGQGGFLEGCTRQPILLLTSASCASISESESSLLTDQYHDGHMYAGMIVCEFVLADEGPGDGGLAV